MVLPVEVGHSIGVVQDPGATQRAAEDRDSNAQGADHQGKSALKPTSHYIPHYHYSAPQLLLAVCVCACTVTTISRFGINRNQICCQGGCVMTGVCVIVK